MPPAIQRRRRTPHVIIEEDEETFGGGVVDLTMNSRSDSKAPLTIHALMMARREVSHDGETVRLRLLQLIDVDQGIPRCRVTERGNENAVTRTYIVRHPISELFG